MAIQRPISETPMSDAQFYRVYTTINGYRYYLAGGYWSMWSWAAERFEFDEAKMIAESERAQYEPFRSGSRSGSH
jgi:hypothetical protein